MLQPEILSDDTEDIELAMQYWQFDPVAENFPIPASEIAAKLGKKTSELSGYFTYVCIAYEDHIICPACKRTGHTAFASRSEYQTFYKRHLRNSEFFEKTCNACLFSLNELQRIEKEALDSQKISILLKYKDRRPKIDLSVLSLEQAVFLDAYGRVALTEDYEVALSLEVLWHQKMKLSPMREMDQDIISQLCDRHLIRLHPNNSPEIIANIISEDEWTFYTT